MTPTKQILAMALGVACAAPAAWAADTPIEMSGCYTTDADVLAKVGDVTAGTTVSRGYMDIKGGPTDRMTHECRVVWSASKAGLEFTNRCVNVDKDGDKTISMSNGKPKSYQWMFLSGTGKYQGITGSGTAEVTKHYPRSGAVAVACWEGRGTYTLNR